MQSSMPFAVCQQQLIIQHNYHQKTTVQDISFQSPDNHCRLTHWNENIQMTTMIFFTHDICRRYQYQNRITVYTYVTWLTESHSVSHNFASEIVLFTKLICRKYFSLLKIVSNNTPSYSAILISSGYFNTILP